MLDVLGSHRLDCLLLDLQMEGINGFEVLKAFLARQIHLPVIVITGQGSIAKAVEAMRKGAFDYILKPFKNEEILVTIAKALEHRHLILTNRMLTQDLERRFGSSTIVGDSRKMQEILALTRRVAQFPGVASLYSGKFGFRSSDVYRMLSLM